MKKYLLTTYLLFYVVFINAVGISGTLPVMYINTENGNPIKDKLNYVAATYYIDPMGIEGIEANGNVDNPLSLKIRGRGNFTWGYFDKKPYKLKLDNKQPLLGMKKNKHFALLAHADNDYAFFRNTVAFEISKRLKMPYTPDQHPLEVVLNGDYIGLYFLTETIRIDDNRVNITEQTDGETQDELITGGWLVEIDNNRDSNQIEFSIDGTDLEWLWITYHSPEVLSENQKNYLFNQIENIKQLIYTEDKSSKEWENLVDISSLAKFYIIHEVVDHLEGFLGSCYLYKDREDTKWKFGPVWDLGNAFNNYHDKDKFIYQESPFPVSIINEIVKFPDFQQEVQNIWNEYYPVIMDDIDVFIRNFANQIAHASVCDAERWPNYGDTDVNNSSSEVISILQKKLSWLNSQWSINNSINTVQSTNKYAENYYDLLGRRMLTPRKKSLYILNEIYPNGLVKVRKVIYNDNNHL